MMSKNNTLYRGTDRWINEKTGEVITTEQVIKKVDRKDFEITYLSYFMDLFDQLGGQKYKVFKYIIENKNSENQLIITTRELAEKTKTSLPTVSATLKLLRESGLIAQRTGAIMLYPKIAHKGDGFREKYLLMKFSEFDDSENEF